MNVQRGETGQLKVFFGTVVRSAPVRDGGELVRLDWASKSIDARVAIFPTEPRLDHDPNPRGNSRGCRGIEIIGDRVAASTYHTVKLFDLQLRHERDVSHGLMVGVHEVCAERSGSLWLSSTAIDAAIECDLDTGAMLSAIWPREMAAFQRELGLAPLELDKEADQRAAFLADHHVRNPSHLHLNAVARWEGQTLALFHAPGAIANLTSGEILVTDEALKGAHNLVAIEGDVFAVDDTYGRTVRLYDLRARELVKVIDVAAFPFARALERRAAAKSSASRVLGKLGLTQATVARPLFVRGLDRVGDLLFVGVSPASVLAIDWRRGELVDAYRYSADVEVCVHGLKVLSC